jgi:hypothetical protein
MAYPKIVGNLSTEGLDPSLIKHEKILGYVDPDGLTYSDPLVQKLLSFLKEFPYSYRRCSSYSDVSLLHLSGSVFPHVDKGLGLMANWLIYYKELDFYEDRKQLKSLEEKPMLFTGRGNLDLSLGDVFIFNGDEEHGWISNCHCTLVQITV